MARAATGPGYAGWLQVARRSLVPPLCSAPALARLLALGAHLPGSCQGSIELHLGAGGGAVDLSVRVENPEQARQMAELSLPAHLRSFLKDWSEREGRFSCIPCVWLEFDLDSQAPAADLPTPSVCVRLPQRHAGLDWVLETLLPSLHGERLEEAQRESMRRCYGEIPREASLLYVFSLLSRPGRPVRMELFGLDPDGANAYLRRVAPQAVPPPAAAAPLFAGIDRPHLSFDLDAAGEILPRVGLEGSFARQSEPGWKELLARLVARGLCAPNEMNAILAWPGYDTVWTAGADWPLERSGMRGFCVRSLSHVKVVTQPGREPEAKVYLLVSYVAGANS